MCYSYLHWRTQLAKGFSTSIFWGILFLISLALTKYRLILQLFVSWVKDGFMYDKRAESSVLPHLLICASPAFGQDRFYFISPVFRVSISSVSVLMIFIIIFFLPVTTYCLSIINLSYLIVTGVSASSSRYEGMGRWGCDFPHQSSSLSQVWSSPPPTTGQCREPVDLTAPSSTWHFLRSTLTFSQNISPCCNYSINQQIPP